MQKALPKISCWLFVTVFYRKHFQLQKQSKHSFDICLCYFLDGVGSIRLKNESKSMNKNHDMHNLLKMVCTYTQSDTHMYACYDNPA